MQEKFPVRFEADCIRQYMQSNIFAEKFVIPLWDPSPGANCRQTSNVCVGDVGFLTDDGGFHILFNTFLSSTDNELLGFKPPKDFKPYGEGEVQFSQDVSKITPISDTHACDGDFKSAGTRCHPDHPER